MIVRKIFYWKEKIYNKFDFFFFLCSIESLNLEYHYLSLVIIFISIYFMECWCFIILYIYIYIFILIKMTDYHYIINYNEYNCNVAVILKTPILARQTYWCTSITKWQLYEMNFKFNGLLKILFWLNIQFAWSINFFMKLLFFFWNYYYFIIKGLIIFKA